MLAPDNAGPKYLRVLTNEKDVKEGVEAGSCDPTLDSVIYAVESLLPKQRLLALQYASPHPGITSGRLILPQH